MVLVVFTTSGDEWNRCSSLGGRQGTSIKPPKRRCSRVPGSAQGLTWQGGGCLCSLLFLLPLRIRAGEEEVGWGRGTRSGPSWILSRLRAVNSGAL